MLHKYFCINKTNSKINKRNLENRRLDYLIRNIIEDKPGWFGQYGLLGPELYFSQSLPTVSFRYICEWKHTRLSKFTCNSKATDSWEPWGLPFNRWSLKITKFETTKFWFLLYPLASHYLGFECSSGKQCSNTWVCFSGFHTLIQRKTWRTLLKDISVKKT